MTTSSDRAKPSYRIMEIVVASVLVCVGLLVVVDNYLLGASWQADGPEAGYFPFYCGLFLSVSSLVTIGQAIRAGSPQGFINRASFLRILQVLVPSTAFVALIAMLGIYVASCIFIAFCMRLLGRFGAFPVIAVSLAVPFALFALFELWFHVPMPKGPLEDFLGY